MRVCSNVARKILDYRRSALLILFVQMSEPNGSSLQQNTNVISPGEYVLKKLFSEFVLAGQQKLDFISQQALVR